MNEEEIRKIEALTRGQSRNEHWHQERRWRLTASNFGSIVKVTDRRQMDKFCESLLSPPTLCTAPVVHGRQYESHARNRFTQETGLPVTECGLFVSPDHPFLAASPDGLVGREDLVEVKCPYTARNKFIVADSNFPFLETSGSELSLKMSHNYYEQIQGQLFVTKRKMCYFVIYTFADFKVLKVYYNKRYCEEALLPKLKNFYQCYYKPFITKFLNS